MNWIRVCQNCGNKQEDKEPDDTKELSDAYCNRECKKCHSESLDYGTTEYALEKFGVRIIHFQHSTERFKLYLSKEKRLERIKQILGQTK